MECFKIKYSNSMNPKQQKIFIHSYAIIYLVLGILRLIDEEYFIAVVYLVCVAVMFIAQYSVFLKSRKQNKTPFNGIIIDEEKISVGSGVYGQAREIPFNDVRSIQLNRPYNDTLEITMKDHKSTRVPLYWLAGEDQSRIKELLKNYL